MAVYTPLTNEAISELLDRDFSVGALAFAVGIAQGVENTNYLIATTDAAGQEHKYILTLYEKRVKPEELPFFTGLMQHLAQAGVQCPQPVARRDGQLISMLEGKHAVLVSFLEGKSRTRFTNTHCASVGAALAQLHGAAQGYAGQRANALSLDGWQAIAAKVGARFDEIQPGLAALVHDELAFLATHWPQDLPRGIIHADLFPDNVFFIDDAVSGLIDFYFACDDMLAYDLAITINAWCFEPSREYNRTKAQLMVQHYAKARALSDAERAALPVLLRGAALRFLLTRSHDWLFQEKSALVRPHDPLEYVAKLKFHQHAVETFA